MAPRKIRPSKKRKPVGVVRIYVPGNPPAKKKTSKLSKKKPRPVDELEPAPTVAAPIGAPPKPPIVVAPKPKAIAPEAKIGEAVGLKRSLRNMEILVEAAMKSATPHVDALLDEIRAAIDTPDLVQARLNLDGMVWAEQRKYADTTYVHIKRADAYGHLETAKRRDKIIDIDGFVMLQPKEGLEYFKQRKVISPEAWAYADDKTKLKGFSVAKATSEYHVEYTKNAITAVLEGELDERDFRKRMANMLGTSHRDYYIETVYRTNMQSAYQHGRYVQQTHPEVLEALPFWQYKTVGDSRVRDSHAAMDGKIYPASHNIWDLWYPPNGYSCRCRVDELSRSEAVDEGVLEEMPKEQPDEGFANSPKDWLEREF